MKNKIFRFVIVSFVFTVMLFLGSLLFDLIDKKEFELVKAIREALFVGVLTGFFMVFLTNFFNKSDKT